MLLRFLDLLFPPRENERLVRSLGNDGLAVFLDPKTSLLGDIEVTGLLPYDARIVRACIVEAKYHANDRASKVLGAILAAYLGEELADRNQYEPRTYALVPVPLSRARLRERGYNQAEAITRHAADMHPEIVIESDLMMRIRDTLPQTTLGGEARRQNVRGAFGAARTPDPHTTYIVIDDVVTTGATIREVVQALRGAGAQNVRAIGLAHRIGKPAENAVG